MRAAGNGEVLLNSDGEEWKAGTVKRLQDREMVCASDLCMQTLTWVYRSKGLSLLLRASILVVCRVGIIVTSAVMNCLRVHRMSERSSRELYKYIRAAPRGAKYFTRLFYLKDEDSRYPRELKEYDHIPGI